MSGKGSRPRPFSVSQQEFADNFDKIFRNKQMSPSTEQMKKGTCGCGRSPTGNCCGWHALSEEAYKQRLEQYETGKADLSGKDVK